MEKRRNKWFNMIGLLILSLMIYSMFRMVGCAVDELPDGCMFPETEEEVDYYE